MESPSRPAPASKPMLWTGYVLTALPALGLIASGVLKLMRPAEVLKEFSRLGWPENLALPLGIVEITCAILYIIPRTSVLGAILITGYLGGATATHVRVGDNFVPPILFGVLAWLGLYLRDARLRALLPVQRQDTLRSIK
jgi:hypothetical protein